MEISEAALRTMVREVDEQHRDGMATMADDIAQLHEATRVGRGRSRRGVIKAAAITGAAVTIGNTVLPIGRLLPASAQEAELDDPTIAGFAESIELAAVEAYTAAVASGKVKSKAVADAAGVFSAHHQEHAAAFGAAAGAKRTAKANPKLVKSLADALPARRPTSAPCWTSRSTWKTRRRRRISSHSVH